jgi:hypothetical protein
MRTKLIARGSNAEGEVIGYAVVFDDSEVVQNATYLIETAFDDVVMRLEFLNCPDWVALGSFTNEELLAEIRATQESYFV